MALWEAATGEDTVAGVPARFVAAPASTEEASEVLRAAAADDLTVVVRGGATKLDWGMPPRRADLIVDTRHLTGVVEHAAGDLIVVLRAGTPLASLDLPGQQLALDLPLPGATVGGTVATNTSGPRRQAYGTVRDLLIGITVVRPGGMVTRAGGKVVKNVAGYDLGKLYTGSYGTLGLITECAFRLHPRPAAQAVVLRTAPAAAIGALLAAVRAEQVVPAAVELDAPAQGPVTLAVLVEGTAIGVRDRAATLAKVLDGEVTDTLPPWWGAYPWTGEEAGLKLTAALSRVPDLLGCGVALRGSAGTGVLYAAVPAEGAPTVVERLRATAIRAGGHGVVLTAPPPVRDQVDMWGPMPGLALMRRVKDQFDPAHAFAPGRFVGGI
ncbi:FAD-binding oxidoreductase [Actinoplanes friuliensis]|uniref:Glycolate oxidase FAD binding subunit n=1 Tax=Actinoplanes friuliensis DSM 7358 TaxID=1246995 RepID=U5VZJ4_9ACTN|nr:FAD-binding oxidoreductase [Actinoplanes friuliensis]AGZ42192.1 glycolate oxidase FAD binding subunit [Actinoplanes friuliensis DSM 7358]